LSVASSQVNINVVVPTSPLTTNAVVDLPIVITNPPRRRKGIPTVSNFVSGIRTVVSGAASAVLNRFSAPREAVTSGLNVRLSSTTANVVSTPCELPCELPCLE
jgi:hypothetical protein